MTTAFLVACALTASDIVLLWAVLRLGARYRRRQKAREIAAMTGRPLRRDP